MLFRVCKVLILLGLEIFLKADLEELFGFLGQR
jgi:hypothetical protein